MDQASLSNGNKKESRAYKRKLMGSEYKVASAVFRNTHKKGQPNGLTFFVV